MKLPLTATLIDPIRFWAKVQKTSTCWLWLGAKLPKGYGKVGIKRDGVRHYYLAHRISFAIANGETPDDLLVLHTCDNPPCVNPAHLFLGTQQENLDDAARKQRTKRKEQHPHATLTTVQVAEIRQLRATGMKQHAIAAKFGISRAYVSELCGNKCRTWHD